MISASRFFYETEMSLKVFFLDAIPAAGGQGRKNNNNKKKKKKGK